jgi:hypothetical protein
MLAYQAAQGLTRLHLAASALKESVRMQHPGGEYLRKKRCPLCTRGVEYAKRLECRRGSL